MRCGLELTALAVSCNVHVRFAFRMRSVVRTLGASQQAYVLRMSSERSRPG